MLHALNNAAVRHVPPDTLLGSTDGFQLGIELRHKAEGHAQDQTQGRDDPPEEIHELVRSHDFIIAGEPLHHAHQHGGGGHTVDETLQGDGVVIRSVGQDGDALMVEGRIQDCRQEHHGQQEPQGEKKPFSPLEIEIVCCGAAQRDEQANGVHEAHPEDQNQGEKQEVHQRVIA